MKFIVIAAHYQQARLIMEKKGLNPGSTRYASRPEMLRGIGEGWTILVAGDLWSGSEQWGHDLTMCELAGAQRERVFT